MMNFLQDFLPILIYVLLIVILIVGIVLGIHFIKTMKKVEKVVDDVNDKVKSLNGFFNIIDFTTDRIVEFNDNLVERISKFAGWVIGFAKKRNKKKKNGEEIE